MSRIPRIKVMMILKVNKEVLPLAAKALFNIEPQSLDSTIVN